jgi:hypothetical protein
MWWKTESRLRVRGVLLRKPMCSATRFFAASKKRRRIADRDDMLVVSFSFAGMLMSSAMRRVASWERVEGGVWRRWRVDSGLSWGAVKRIDEVEVRRALLRVVIARVQAGSHVKRVVWVGAVRRNWIRWSSSTS